MTVSVFPVNALDVHRCEFLGCSLYLNIYILTKENKRAHKIPMVLTLKGLNGTDVSEKIKMFEKEMSKCLSRALDSEVPLNFNDKFQATTVFCPLASLIATTDGSSRTMPTSFV